MTKKEIIIEAFNNDPNFNRRELSSRCNIDPSFIRKTLRKIRRSAMAEPPTEIHPNETIEFRQTSDSSASLQSNSETITTLEQALAAAKVDLTEWEVDRYTIGSYQSTVKVKDAATGATAPKTVTMHKIQIWLKRTNVIMIKAFRELIKEIPKIETIYETKLGDPLGDYLLEVALFDVHFGMLAWGKETVHDYDIDIAEDLFLHAVQDLLAKTKGFPISRILFPFGNDFLHIDDPTNLTPKNHNILDVDSRLIKLYGKAKKAVIKAINYCRQVAPVDVQWIPGNHDPNISYYLCDVIGEVFSQTKDVRVDVSPRWRKFYPWGKSLICFTHGEEEKLIDLPNIMATEASELWGKSVYREIHIGHKHKKRELRWINVDTFPGCVVRMIPSIASEDAWSYRKGFIRGWYAAESYLWNKNTGMEAQFTSFMDYEKYKAKDRVSGVPLWKLEKI